MRVLIVGCGYVGLQLGEQLVNRGHEVFGLRRDAAAEGELNASGIQLLVGDITKQGDLRRLSPHYDWVANCVSSAGGGVQAYRQTYLQGTSILLEWLGPAPLKKLIYTSSTSVYGQTDGSAVDETSAAEPASETAQLLVQTEKLLMNIFRQQSFPAMILRVAGIYGPGRGYWLQSYLKGDTRIEGQGLRILNMIHRDDVAGAIVAAFERGRPGEIYNAVDDEPVAQIDLFRWMAEKMGGPLPPIIQENEGAVVKSKRGSTNKRVLNRKLRAELSYQLKYPTFREGLLNAEWGMSLPGNTPWGLER